MGCRALIRPPPCANRLTVWLQANCQATFALDQQGVANLCFDSTDSLMRCFGANGASDAYSYISSCTETSSCLISGPTGYCKVRHPHEQRASCAGIQWVGWRSSPLAPHQAPADPSKHAGAPLPLQTVCNVGTRCYDESNPENICYDSGSGDGVCPGGTTCTVNPNNGVGTCVVRAFPQLFPFFGCLGY